MKRLLIVGPPGVGKGTQAARLSGVLGIPAISTGDIFREQVRLRSALGLEVAAIMEAGEYVPDSITTALVEARLEQRDAAGGFILDGYPRTLAQVDDLDRMLAAANTNLDAVVHLDVHEDELIARLLQRGIDDGRADDTAEAIERRIDVFTAQTAPLLHAYRERGLLVSIDGLGSVDAVTVRVNDALNLTSPEGRQSGLWIEFRDQIDAPHGREKDA
jgi:adenylate kinase